MRDWVGYPSGDVAEWAGAQVIMWRMHPTFHVSWSAEDGQWVATADEFRSASWLADTPEAALDGLIPVILDALDDGDDDYDEAAQVVADRFRGQGFDDCAALVDLLADPERYRGNTAAPLSLAAIAALRDAVAGGDGAVRRVQAVKVDPWTWTFQPFRNSPTLRRMEVRRRLENIRRIAWEDRLREWMAASVSIVSYGRDRVWPIAPDRIPEDQRWANWFAYSEDDALNVALVRMYGCRCVFPLLRWTMKHDSVDGWEPTTPRCRTCNAQAD